MPRCVVTSDLLHRCPNSEKMEDERLEAGTNGSLLSLDKGKEEDTPIETNLLPRMSTQARVAHTVLIFGTFLGFGLCRGIYGPTLVELRTVTGVSLTQISMLFTCLGVGGIAGSLTFGRLFDMFNPLALFAGALGSLALVTSIIPWLHVLTVMMAACAAHSFLYSGLAIGCTVTLFRIWRECSRQIFLSMHLLYTIGGFLAPLLSEPFLTDPAASEQLPTSNLSISLEISPLSNSTGHNIKQHKTSNEVKISYANVGMGSNITSKRAVPAERIMSYVINQSHIERQVDENVYNQTFADPGIMQSMTGFDNNIIMHPRFSRIVFTYLIIGIYLLTVSIGMICLFLCTHSKKLGAYWKNDQKKTAPPCQGGGSLFRCLATILFMLYNLNFGGQETVYSGLLFTFAVEYAGFSPSKGTLLVSMLYTAHTVGRFVVIFISHWVPNALYVLICSVCGCTISCALLTYFTTTNTTAIWAAAVIGGLSLSTMYGMGLLWAKEFVSISATFASFYTIAYTTGMMLWPPVTSLCMKTYGADWFAYMNIILLLGYTTAIILLASLQRCRHRFKNCDIVEDEELEYKVKGNRDDLIAHSIHSLQSV